MSNLKVEGKVSDLCLNCKNCKGITQECNGKTASMRIIEVECVDPYDGMTKTLSADSDICCSMFEPKSDRSCENDIYVTSYMGLYEEKKEKEPCDKISLLQHELEMERLRTKIHQLEKEKSAHLKGIERLKKSQEKLQNQVKNLQTTNEESYKREEKLEDKVHKLQRRLLEENKRFDRLDTELLTPLVRVLYPREAKICKPYSEVIEDIKRLVDKSEILEQRYDNIHYTLYKDWSDDSISCPRDIPSNVKMIEDLKKRAADSDYYKEKSEFLEERNNNQFDTIRKKDKKIDTLLNTNKGLTDKIGKLTNKIVTQQSTHYKQCARILDLENMVNKLQSGEYDDILAKDIEIKSLQDKYESAMTGWKDAIDTNDKMIGEKDKQIEELTRRYNMIAKKLNDIHDILKEDPNNE